jgi:type IV secretion system protein VirB9
MRALQQRAVAAQQAADQAMAQSRQIQAAYDNQHPTITSAAGPPVATPGATGAAVRPPSVRHPQPVPRAPTIDDVWRLQRELDQALAERRTEHVTDSGTLSAAFASASRSAIVFPYVPDSLYEVYAAPDHMTTIELQPGEALTTSNGKPLSADTVQWIADSVVAGAGAERRVIIMVKPTMTGIETNMLIPTNRHVYNLVLRSVSRAYMPVVDFSYPPDDPPAPAPAPASVSATVASNTTSEAVAVAPDAMNFNYRVRDVRGKHVIWAPLRVFDDGSKTYLQMPPEMRSWEAPALFVMEDKKTPLLVNYRVRGDYYIVDRLFEHAQLRVGANQVVDVDRVEPRRG